MIVMAMLAFFVFVSRYYVTCRNRQFEQSRWMIVVALLLFVVHYMCQMRLGWRQQGNDVGVLFNLLFYSPRLFCCHGRSLIFCALGIDVGVLCAMALLDMLLWYCA